MPIKASTGSGKTPAADKKIPKKRTLKSVAKKVSPADKKKAAEMLKSKLPATVKKKKEVGKKIDGTPKKSNAGAKPVITEYVLRQLEMCFMVGMTDEEACVFCDISTTAFYDYQKANPEFSEKKSLWKNKITLQAKINIGRKIKEGCDFNSKWWLERKARKEFGSRVGLVDDSDIKEEENEADQDMYELILSRRKK